MLEMTCTCRVLLRGIHHRVTRTSLTNAFSKSWICTCCHSEQFIDRSRTCNGRWFQFRWFREIDGELTEIAPRRRNMFGGGVGESHVGPLLLSGVRREDSGVFVCRVNNSISQAEVRVTLQVYGEAVDRYFLLSPFISISPNFYFFCRLHFNLNALPFQFHFEFNSLPKCWQWTSVDRQPFIVTRLVVPSMRFRGSRTAETWQMP